MSSSTEALLRGAAAETATVAATPELRDGSWTRLGGSSVLGDLVTEQALAGLAESTRTAARAQGYATGWAEGRREAAAEAAAVAARAEQERVAAETRREAEHRAALAGLERAASALQRTSVTVAADLEEQALRLARELTRELVGHELRTSPDPAADVVRRALVVLPAGVPVTVRLHPDVAASTVAADLAGLAGPAGQQLTVVPDAGLERDDAVVETAEQVVDLRVGAALERVAEALR